MTTVACTGTPHHLNHHVLDRTHLCKRRYDGHLAPPPLRRLFRQPLVPVVADVDGRWLLPEPLAPLMKPGGHGAIWKLMLDEGVFDWLLADQREAAIVRQIRCAAVASCGVRMWCANVVCSTIGSSQPAMSPQE